MEVVRAARDDLVRVIARLDSQLKSKVLVLMGQKNTLSQDTRQIYIEFQLQSAPKGAADCKEQGLDVARRGRQQEPQGDVCDGPGQGLLFFVNKYLIN